MSFMVDLKIDIRTKEMLNITPCKVIELYFDCKLSKGLLYPKPLLHMKIVYHLYDFLWCYVRYMNLIKKW